MKKRWLRIAGLAKYVTDAMILIGCGALVYGIYLVYHPAAYIFGGLFLIGWAVFIEYNNDRGK
jgi:hypothetical protein